MMLSDYEGLTACLIEQLDERIEKLSRCSREESPQISAACREEISMLIANREGLKRGLIKPDASGCLCSLCPDETGEKV